MKRPRVFICYRRADTRADTARIYDRLVRGLGKKNVFIDTHGIEAGTYFPAVIKSAIDKCDFLLAIIGKNWLNAVDDKGQRRIDAADDFVRFEISYALQRNVTVIPVLVDQANLPKADDLPPDLHELAFRHAIPIRDDPHFQTDMNRLLNRIIPPISWRKRWVTALLMLMVFIVTTTVLSWLLRPEGIQFTLLLDLADNLLTLEIQEQPPVDLAELRFGVGSERWTLQDLFPGWDIASLSPPICIDLIANTVGNAPPSGCSSGVASATVSRRISDIFWRQDQKPGGGFLPFEIYFRDNLCGRMTWEMHLQVQRFSC